MWGKFLNFIYQCGSLVVSTLEPFLFTMLKNFGKYAPNLPTPYTSSQIIYKFIWAGG